MGLISLSQFIVLCFFVLLIFGDFSHLVDKIRLSFKKFNKKNRKKGS